MKLQSYIIALFIISLAFITSCTKDEEPQLQVDNLRGVWVLVQKEIINGNTVTKIPLQGSSQSLVFGESNQFKSTVEGDSVLTRANYYWIGTTEIAGPYFVVGETATTTVGSNLYFYTAYSHEGRLYTRGKGPVDGSAINYTFQRQ